MLRHNQKGSIDYFLYGLATISLLAFGFFLILALAGTDEPVKTTTTIEQREAESRVEDYQIPREWHTYTNPENDYTFSYPMEWGVVEQASSGGENPSYTYTFTSNEPTIISQVHKLSAEPVHSQDYLVYNRFNTNDTTVTYCGTDACQKSTSLSTDEVRIFTTQTKLDATELRIIDDTDLRLIHVVNTDYEDWPGIVISSVLQDNVNTSLSLDEIVEDAVTNNYVRNETLRQFVDFSR